MGFLFRFLAPAAMPGDDLLFQRLSVSTIGAVWFHGRVRDGIGWGTDAMVTKQCSRRKETEQKTHSHSPHRPWPKTRTQAAGYKGGQKPSPSAGWSSPVARQAHNLKVAGSNPAPATMEF